METVYILDGDIYCTKCGPTLQDAKEVMNGEADTPQHCGNCGIILENPLTTDGFEYVKATWFDYLYFDLGITKVVYEWADIYKDYCTTEEEYDLVTSTIEKCESKLFQNKS